MDTHLEQPSKLLRFASDEHVAFDGARHDALMFRTPNTVYNLPSAVAKSRWAVEPGTDNEGKKHFGWSWPAKPALMVPEPWKHISVSVDALSMSRETRSHCR
jgi:hypothetical protein